MKNNPLNIKPAIAANEVDPRHFRYLEAQRNAKKRVVHNTGKDFFNDELIS